MKCDICAWKNCKDYGKPIIACHEWFSQEIKFKLDKLK